MLIEAKKLIQNVLSDLENKKVQYYNHGIIERTFYIRAVIDECSGNLNQLVDTEKVYSKTLSLVKKD
jgi:hypothetical protein